MKTGRLQFLLGGLLLLLLAAVAIFSYFILLTPGKSGDLYFDISQPATTHTLSLRNKDLNFINQTLPVLATWNLQTLMPYLSPITRAEADHSFKAVFVILEKQLGGLISYDSPTSAKTITLTNESDNKSYTITPYSFNAQFEHGNATLTLSLMNLAEKRYLHSLDISFSE